MTLSRESIQRMITDMVGGGGGGAGISGSALANLLTGYATQDWVGENYISIEFFSRLFQAHGTENGQQTDITPNDMDSTITSIEALFGFWTDLYVSALGNGGSIGSSIYLSTLADVQLSSPATGQVLTYNASTGMWVNANPQGGVTDLASLTDVTLTSLQANQVLVYNGNTWINSSVKTINGNSIFGTGDIPASGGGGGNYLPLAGGTMTGNILYNTGAGSFNIAKYGTANVDYGWNYENRLGAGIAFRGASRQEQPGYFVLYARDSSNEMILTGTPNGSLFLNTSDGDFYSYKFETHNFNIGWDFSNRRGALVALRSSSYTDEGQSGAFVLVARNGSYNKTLVGKPAGDLTWGNITLSNIGISIGTTLGAEDSAYKCVCSAPYQTWTSIARYFLSTLGNGQNVTINVGKQQASRNEGVFGFHYAGSNSTSNFVWIGMNSVDFKLVVDGNGYVGVNTSSPSYNLHVAGTIYATGAITALSDARKKDITGEAGVTVEQIAHAPAVQFLWKDKERRKDGQQVGTLAQYWQAVLPEVVMDKGGELSMQYGVAALVSAIITARKVVDHERRIQELEKENQDLRREISNIRVKTNIHMRGGIG